VNINKGFLFISCWICWMNISALWMSMGIPFFGEPQISTGWRSLNFYVQPMKDFDMSHTKS
jgi:hypothetical protein